MTNLKNISEIKLLNQCIRRAVYVLSHAVNPTSYHKGKVFPIYFVKELFLKNKWYFMHKWVTLPPQWFCPPKKWIKFFKKSINDNYIINKDQYQIIFWCLFLYRSGDYNDNLFFWFLICMMHGGYLEIVRGERCKKGHLLTTYLSKLSLQVFLKRNLMPLSLKDIWSLMIFWYNWDITMKHIWHLQLEHASVFKKNNVYYIRFNETREVTLIVNINLPSGDKPSHV